MANRAKSTGSTPRSRRGRKPATIDLQVKDVTADKPAGAMSDAAKKATSPATSADINLRTKKPDTAPAGRKDKPAASGFGRQASKPGDPPPPFATPASIVKNLTGPGFGKLLLSALFGGALTAAGLGAIGQFSGSSRLPLIGSLYGGGNSGQADQQTVSAITELQTRMDEIATGGQNSQPVDLDPIHSRIAQLEAALAELTTGAGASNVAAADSRISGLETRMDELGSAISGISEAAADAGEADSNPQIAAAIADLGVRLGSMEQSLASQANTQNPEIGQITIRLDELQSALEKQGSPDMAPLETQISQTLANLAAIQSSTEQNTAGLQALSSKSAELATRLASVKTSEKIARSVAATALGSALENGSRLAIPVSSIEALAGSSDETRRLAEISATGIASLEELAADFAVLAAEIEAPNDVNPDEGMVARFMANARSLVTIRPSGPIDGSTTAAILSRIRAHVNDGQLQPIASEWEKLPADARSLGQAWITRVNIRIEAFALFEIISSQLVQN